MISSKDVILTAIAYKGTAAVREQASELAADTLCSKAHVLSLVRQVEQHKIVVTPAS